MNPMEMGIDTLSIMGMTAERSWKWLGGNGME